MLLKIKKASKNLLNHKLWIQSSRFTIVGLTAAAIHFFSLTLLVRLAWQPLWANPIAFLIAFSASFLGHWHFTFKQQATWQKSLPRFFCIACLSFGLNQLGFWALLTYTPLHYQPALILVLAAVACITFLLSRCWGFAAK